MVHVNFSILTYFIYFIYLSIKFMLVFKELFNVLIIGLSECHLLYLLGARAVPVGDYGLDVARTSCWEHGVASVLHSPLFYYDKIED